MKLTNNLKIYFYSFRTINTNYFIKNLLYITIGTSFSVLLIFVFNVLSGRLLGPNEYGKYSLVQSIALFLFIPMLLGFNTAMIKYTSENDSLETNKKIISTTYLMVLILSIIVTGIYLLLSNIFISLFSISVDALILSILFSILYVFYTLTTSTLKGLFKIKLLSVIQVIYSIFVIASFILFIYIDQISYKSIIYAIFIGYLSVIVLTAYVIKKYISIMYEPYWLKTLLKYGIYSSIGGLSFIILTNTDKILIGKFLTLNDLGVYGAYYFAAMNCIGIFFNIFNSIYFPYISKANDKIKIFNTLNRLIPLISFVVFMSVIIIELITLLLFGNKYPIIIEYIILFGLSATLAFISDCYIWLFASTGNSGIRFTALSELGISLINVVLNIILIPSVGISGSIIATILSYVILIIIVQANKNHIINNKQTSKVI